MPAEEWAIVERLLAESERVTAPATTPEQHDGVRVYFARVFHRVLTDEEIRLFAKYMETRFK
jgi:hypothetical protein